MFATKFSTQLYGMNMNIWTMLLLRILVSVSYKYQVTNLRTKNIQMLLYRLHFSTSLNACKVIGSKLPIYNNNTCSMDGNVSLSISPSTTLVRNISTTIAWISMTFDADTHGALGWILITCWPPDFSSVAIISLISSCPIFGFMTKCQQN